VPSQGRLAVGRFDVPGLGVAGDLEHLVEASHFDRDRFRRSSVFSLGVGEEKKLGSFFLQFRSLFLS
jgi:hypothetical protein